MDRRILEMCREIDAAKLATAQEGVTAWAEKLLEDAERYRWLRAENDLEIIFTDTWTHPHSGEKYGDLSSVLTNEDFDAAIDTARASEPK